MPAPVAPEPRPPDPDAAPVGRLATDVPDPDAATERLRALLRDEEPWSERVAERLAALRSSTGATRALLAVVAAIGLGAAAFALVGGGRGGSVDPVQVLPTADPRAARPSAAAAGTPSAAAGAPGADPSGAPPGSAPAPSPPGTTAALLVHAAGAVASPGLHQVPAGARIADLIAASGGLAADADPDRINLAAPLRDGERVYVPRRGEATAPEVIAGGPDPAGGAGAPDGAASTAVPSGPAPRVDLNTADAAALDALPGVGPATAAAIIAHRSEHGPFTSVDELQEVAGIGPAKLARLRDLVRV